MTKRPKKSDAWKKLRKSYMRGPKRVKVPTRRRAKNYDPLEDLTRCKRIQLTLEGNKHIAFLITKEAFERLNLKDGETYTMPRNRLTRAGKAFQTIFKVADHNSYVMKKSKEAKLANGVGRCIVWYGTKLKSPAAVLRIQRSVEEQKREEIHQLRVQKFFDTSTNAFDYHDKYQYN